MISREPALCACGDHTFAAITRGYVVLVSPEDAWLLEKLWVAKPDKSTVYAQRNERRQGASVCVRLHREIVTDAPVVDHVNHNGLDNRRPNLRGATISQNTANRKIGASGSIGVHRHKKTFRAAIWENGRNRYLGFFSTKEEAMAARDAAARQRWGEFASLNKTENHGD